MYNRYIPQHDGSYQKRAVSDQRKPAQQPRTNPPPSPPPPTHETQPIKRREDGNIGGFLKNLLPKGFDTGDLIIVLLLILMAGDCEEDQNTALLTLALYFFM